MVEGSRAVCAGSTGTYMTHKVGPKGQVVIPKDLREEFGIEPGALDRPVMSWSNLGEVFCIVRRDRRSS